MKSATRDPEHEVRQGRSSSVWTILGDYWERAWLRIDGALRRNAGQPQRLIDLRKEMLEDGRAPFRAAAAVGEIQSFLADPAAYRSREAAWWGNGDGLAGACIRHVLDAQALAFSNRPSESAEAMLRALGALDRSTESQATPAGRHRALLKALGESFRRDQVLLANRANRSSQMLLAYKDRQEADGTHPLLPYLEHRRARRLLFAGLFVDATTALDRALAITGSVDADDFTAYAIEMADIAVRAEGAADPKAASLLTSATRRLDAAAKGKPQFAKHAIGLADTALRADADPEATSLLASAMRWLDAAAKSDPERVGVFAYWQGRVALAQAVRAGKAEKANAGRHAAMRAIDRFEEAVGSSGRRADADAAASWLPEARRQLALHALCLRDAKSFWDALRQEGDSSPPTPAAGESFALGWSGLASSFRHIDTPFGRELIQFAAADFMQRRGALMPPAVPRRLVLEFSDTVPSTDPQGERLIGRDVAPEELDGDGLAPDDRRYPSIWALRRILRWRFGVSLPPVLVRPVPSQGPLKQIAVLLDDSQVYAAVWVEAAAEAAAGEMELEDFLRRRGAAGWPFARYRTLSPPEAGIETEHIDAVQYTAWHLGRAVLRLLPQLTGPEHARHLRLDHLPSKVTYPMLQLLLSDRTPLLEHDALRDLAMDAAAGRLSATAAAETYRRVPAVRSSLWGVEGSWEERALLPEHEMELKQLLSSDSLAGAVPAELFEAINRAAGRPTSLASAPARSTDEPPPRLVVREPALRPWLRALMWQHPDVPVVTASEIDLPPLQQLVS